MPYTIIADETTDAFSNQEILTLCLRFVDLSSPSNPHLKECLLSFIDLERANAETINRKILETLSSPPVSLDIRKICGEAYDGAAVMSSHKAVFKLKLKQSVQSLVHTLLFTLPKPINCCFLWCS